MEDSIRCMAQQIDTNIMTLGKAKIDMSDPNGWTVRTKDRKPTAQWEVQIVVTETGYELLSW